MKMTSISQAKTQWKVKTKGVNLGIITIINLKRKSKLSRTKRLGI